MNSTRLLLYFAYGSNMSSAVMLERCPGAEPHGSARLADHRLAFRLPSQRWGGYAADIVPDTDSAVWGVLWTVTEEHLGILDRYEARYDRYPIRVVNGRLVDALTYRVKSELVSVDGAPDPQYLAHLATGAAEHHLPAGYISSLRSKYEVPGT